MEVVEHIGVVSLQWNTIWADLDGEDTIYFLGFFILIISLSCLLSVSCFFFFGIFLASRLWIDVRSLGLGLHFIMKSTHLVLSQDDINVVVELNIHLNCIDDIKVTLSFLVVSTLIWDSALSGQDLGHVIILYVGKSLLVIFVSSTCEIMQVINNGENFSVHHHKLNQSHVLSFIGLEILTIEDLSEGSHDDRNLCIIQSI